jgi:hypothetical protein
VTRAIMNTQNTLLYGNADESKSKKH